MSNGHPRLTWEKKFKYKTISQFKIKGPYSNLNPRKLKILYRKINIFLIKNCDLLIPRHPYYKGRPIYCRSLQPSKENIQHFNMNYMKFFLFCGSFCPPGSGSANPMRIQQTKINADFRNHTVQIRFRIHNILLLSFIKDEVTFRFDRYGRSFSRSIYNNF